MKNKKKMGSCYAGFSAACRGALPDGSAGADRAGGSHTGAGESPEADRRLGGDVPCDASGKSFQEDDGVMSVKSIAFRMK